MVVESSFFVLAGLIVAVMDHEHFRIMVLYKKKKAAQKALQEANDDIKGLEVLMMISRDSRY
ncbi:hypothetical protein DPMN_000982 [Dreissena polymorpha]|uniref:Uncharacterized protein n=1 Tax=Dreissena polymorpha TaxID=45954 RepID=A0A9D4RSI4_DREPO|nr:hypothetical protein DPMN_000982 [Dreissena polymorpha]